MVGLASPLVVMIETVFGLPNQIFKREFYSLPTLNCFKYINNVHGRKHLYIKPNGAIFVDMSDPEAKLSDKLAILEPENTWTF